MEGVRKTAKSTGQDIMYPGRDLNLRSYEYEAGRKRISNSFCETSLSYSRILLGNTVLWRDHGCVRVCGR
jgi:hypothetical protein